MIKRLPPKEYGELCHTIRTEHGNKIPKNGLMLYGKHLYVYTYDMDAYKIEFVEKIKIDGNELLITDLMRRYENESKVD